MTRPAGVEIVPTRLGCTAVATSGVPPVRSLSGGQSDAHPPVHLILPPFSGVNTYTARPVPLTSTVPTPGTLWIERLLRPLLWVAMVVPEPVVVGAGATDDVLDALLPQAATSTASGAPRSTARDLIGLHPKLRET